MATLFALLVSPDFWWFGLLVLAFGCALSIITVDTAWSDAKKGRRGLMIALAAVLGIAAVGFLIMVTKTTN